MIFGRWREDRELQRKADQYVAEAKAHGSGNLCGHRTRRRVRPLLGVA